MARIARGVAALARAGLDLDHGGFDEIAPVQGGQRQNSRGGVAAGRGDEFRASYRLAMTFRQPVDKALEQIGAAVLAAVVALVKRRALQAKVGARVDDLRRELAEIVDAIHRLPVGQTEKQHVAGLELGDRAELEPRGFPEIGMGVVDELTGEALGGHLLDRAVRMEKENPQQLAARVARATDDGNRGHADLPST